MKAHNVTQDISRSKSPEVIVLRKGSIYYLTTLRRATGADMYM